jgi:subtilisin-like proprotein convertase family protein
MKTPTCKRSIVSRLGCAAALLLVSTTALGEQLSFTGTNIGGIPDNDPAGRTISFAVSGIDVPITTVRVELGLAHTFAGDVTATLSGPGGVPRLVLFGRPGATRTNSFGDSSNFGAIYTFADSGTGGLWTILDTLGNGDTLPADFYRPTSRGAPLRSDAGGCPTSLRGVFGGMTPTETNGTWTLIVNDVVAGDTGSISSATLVLVTDRLLRDGFESGSMAANFDPEATPLGGPSPAPPPAHCINKPLGDFTGDGLTDYVLLRNLGGSPPIVGWFVRENLGDGTASPTETTFSFGTTADFFSFADLDGDRISDPVYWRPDAPGFAKYVTRLSSRNGAERETVFGQTGDDPIQYGDYDGDAIDDFAVYRAPSVTGPIDLIWLGSANRNVSIVSLGTGASSSHFSASGYDINGDGRADAVLQRPDATPPQGRFLVYDAVSNALLENFVLGQANDFIVPGHYVGTPRADMTTGRTISGDLHWFTRDSQTAALSTVVFGNSGDNRIVGDYDGDNLSDHAVWRPGAPGVAAFRVRRSLNPADTPWSVVMGQSGDYPIANSRVK